jgi:hypothetical protein
VVRRFALISVFALALVACANGVQDGITGDSDAATSGGDASAPSQRADDASAGIDASASEGTGPDASTTVAGDAGRDAAVATLDAGVDAANDAAVIVGAKWETPVCDGAIGATEYGAADNHAVSGAQTWYAAWDATHLYVAVDGANVSEGVVLYVGHSGSGLSSGQAYDGARAQTLPFAADAVVYAKQGYTEVRTPSSGAWGVANTAAATLCGTGTVREIVIAWSALGASSVPSGFRWLGYAVSATGYAYAQEPTALPSGFIGQSAVFGKQYHVTSTANGSGTFPFQIVE